MDIFAPQKGVYIFGPFRLDPVRRSLLCEGTPVKLGARLFETLFYLVENHDRLVERDELQHAVWQGRSVEECNLGQAISALRKALQAAGATESCIVTVAGRGYRFAVPVAFEPCPDSVTGTPIVPRPDAGSAATSPVPPARAAIGRLIIGLVAAALLTVLGALLWRLSIAPGVTNLVEATGFAPPPQSVAVMAFTNLSGDPGQEYFSDGLSEELIDGLGRLEKLHVAARLSSFSFKGKSATIGEIARQLNVGTVLEGSVRRDGNRLRITAQLIDARTGYQIWSRSFDRDQADILRVQGEIAEAVTSSLQSSLLGPAAAEFNLGGTDNPRALDAYLRGRTFEIGIDLAAVKAASTALAEAIRLDPNFAVAHARLAMNTLLLSDWESSADPNFVASIRQSALAEADRAISLAPDLGAAHAARGDIFLDMLLFESASAEYSRALQLAPGNADTVRDVSAGLFFLASPARQMDAFRAVKRAVTLDPLSPFGYWDLCYAYFVLHRFDDALAALRHEEELESTITTSDAAMFGKIEVMEGHAQAAHDACAAQRDASENECLALAFTALGRPAEAQAQIDKARVIRGDNDAFEYAEICAQAGQAGEALRWLETALRVHDDGLAAIRQDPLLDPIRNRPEFNDIVQKLKFPP